MNGNLPIMLPRMQDRSAVTIINALVLLLASVFGLWLVGLRGVEIGTDTQTYAGFFEVLSNGIPETRLEPGFVYISYVLRQIGLGVTEYQIALFALLLATVFVAARAYHVYLRADSRLSTYLVLTLALLYFSPMFANATINAIRQGLASLLVFTALLSFQRKEWPLFALFALISISLHYSSILYLIFAPVLMFKGRWPLYLAALSFLLYVSGLSLIAVRTLIPGLYDAVMEYASSAVYRSGVRIDFAIFSIFWYVVLQALLPLVQERYRERISDGATIYLVMLLPFFAVGWGSFSNRYLLPAWLSISLIYAAVFCCGRIRFLRNPFLLQALLLASCPVFYIYITRGIVI